MKIQMVYLRIGTKTMNELKLSAEIYDKKRINEAIEAFSALAKITVFFSDNYYLLSFENCVYDIGETINEFCNYLIDIHNSSGAL